MTSSGYCIALITHHSTPHGPSQRQAVPLKENGDIWEDIIQESLAIRSELSWYTGLSFPRNLAFLSPQ